MKRRMILAIDFDGTIVEHAFPKIGLLKPFAKGAINGLRKEGCYIIIWTCRGGSELMEMINFLDANGIGYDAINENAPVEMIGFKPFPKVYADLYIDDRSESGPPNWLALYEKLTLRIPPVEEWEPEELIYGITKKENL